MSDPIGCSGPLLCALVTAESPQCSLVKLVLGHMHLQMGAYKKKTPEVGILSICAAQKGVHGCFTGSLTNVGRKVLLYPTGFPPVPCMMDAREQTRWIKPHNTKIFLPPLWKLRAQRKRQNNKRESNKTIEGRQVVADVHRCSRWMKSTEQTGTSGVPVVILW